MTAAILFFCKNGDVGILSTLGSHFASAYQIWRESVHPHCRNGILINQKWWPLPSLILVKWHFSSCDPFLGVASYKILATSINPGQSYGYFTKSKIALSHHFRIVMTSIKTNHGEYFAMSCLCKNCNQICYSVLKTLTFSFFSRWLEIAWGFVWGIWPHKWGQPSCGPPSCDTQKEDHCVNPCNLHHCVSKK